MTRSLLLFTEDFAHESFLTALLGRLSQESGVEIDLIRRSTTGGAGAMTVELRAFLGELKKGRSGLPDALIVGRDANCKGYTEQRKLLQKLVPFEISEQTVYAIPDPHIERWLLLDSAAFKQVLGKGCAAPDQKCERDRYKQLLRRAVRETGVQPLLGGLEHIPALVPELDLGKMERIDASFQKLLRDLRSRFNSWRAVRYSA